MRSLMRNSMQIFVICTLLLAIVLCKSNPGESVKLTMLEKFKRFFKGGKSKTAPPSVKSQPPPKQGWGKGLDAKPKDAASSVARPASPAAKPASPATKPAPLKPPVVAAPPKSQPVPSLEKKPPGAVAQQPATPPSSSKQEDDKKDTKPPVEPSKDATSGSDKKPDEEAKESSDKKGSQSAGSDAGKPVGYKFDKLIEDVSQFYNCQNANEPM